MISCNGEPYTLKGVSTVLRGDYANLLQKCDKAAFSYSTRRLLSIQRYKFWRRVKQSRPCSSQIRKVNCINYTQRN